jgi:YcxB-like protein
VTLEFRWTASEYVSAQRTRLMHRPRLIVRRFWYALAIVFMALIGNLVLVLRHPNDWTYALLTVLLFAVVWFPPGILAMWLRWRRDFRLGFPTEGSVSATVDEQGVRLGTKGAEKSTHWVGFSEIYESNRVVIFEKGNDEFLLIPKTQMNPQQIAELRNLIMSKASCKAKRSGQ